MTEFLKLPKFENPEKDIRARVIILISAGMALISVMFLAISFFALPSLLRRAFIIAASAFPLISIVVWLVYSSKLQAASIMLATACWFLVTIGSVTGGGVETPMIIGYFFVITLTSLLMGRRMRLLIAFLCISSLLLIAWAEVNGWLLQARSYSPIGRLIIYAFFFLLVVALQDITAGHIQSLLHRAHESETRYKSFLESIPTVTYINDISPEAKTIYVTPQVETLLGYSQKEFLEDPILWQKIIHPEDKERVLAENSASVETDLPFRTEYRIFSKNQKIVWVRDEAILVPDEQGLPQHWLGVWTDITTRKQAEEEQAELVDIMTRRTTQLQTAAEVSRAVSSILNINVLLPNVAELIRNHFDYYYVGIFLIDESRNWAILKAATGEMGRQMLLTGHRLAVGDSSMIGWCISHRQARIALDVGVDAVRFRNPYLPLTRSEIALPLIAHGELTGAMTIQSVQAAAFSSVDITALQTMADQVANAIENARLFTERAVLIDELEKRNTELERFTYTVSHDLRSPLVTIRGFLGYLRQDAVAGEISRFDKDLSRIANAVDRMQSLLNDLLELSRIGRMINAAQDVPLRQVIDETVDLLTGPLEARKIMVKIEENLPTIYGDHTRIIEIMQNLISNAIKFMGDQPHPLIEIGTRGVDTDGKPVFFVRDNGMGIEPEYQERIFGLFNRLNPEIEGTGIGLTLVRRIVEVHGGRIWVESQPGKGATFFFSLPSSASH